MHKINAAALVAIALAGSIHATVQPGIYEGSFSGASQGDFAFFVAESRSAYLIAFDQTYGEGFAHEFTIGSNGSFSTVIPGSGVAAGTVWNGQASGTADDGAVNFSASVEPQGNTASIAGLYKGTVTGDSNGTLYVAVSPNGGLFFYSDTDTGEDGGSGAMQSNGSFTVTSPFGATYVGSMSVSSRTLSGTYSGGGESGSFNCPLLQDLPDSSDSSGNSCDASACGFNVDWMGCLSCGDGNWIHASEIGWLAYWGTPQSGVFFWAGNAQWLYTDSSTYPFFFQFDNDPAWIWYYEGDDGSSSGQWVYDYGQSANRWLTVSSE